VHILIACPFCENQFKVDPSLRDRQMRCPIESCRQVFEVREVAPPPEAVIDGVPVPSTPPGQKTGQVGQLVPVVGSELATPPAETMPPDAAPDWRKAPPPSVRARDSVPPAPVPVARGVAPPPPRPATATAHTPPPRRTAGADKAPRPAGGSVDLPPGTWEPPPVRRDNGAATAPAARPRTSLEVEGARNLAKSRSRRNKVLMLAVTAVALLGLSLVGGLAYYFLLESEDRDRDAAEKLYAEGLFDQASRKYGELAKKYPESQRKSEYEFLGDLSEVRSLPMQSNRDRAFDVINRFLEQRKDDPRFAEHGQEVADVLLKLLDDAGKLALAEVRNAEAQDNYQRGRDVLKTLRALDDRWVPREKVAEVEVVQVEIDRKLQEEKDRLALIERLKKLAANPSAATIRAVKQILREEAAKPTQFHLDPDVVQVENELYNQHFQTIGFSKDDVPAPDGRPAEDIEPGLVVQPIVGAPGDVANLAADRVFLALARGVLYGLRQDGGAILWAMRVGIDTAHLPLRVPRSGNSPELALVLSADTLSLTAVNAFTGETLWRHRLGSACLGRPVLVDRRVYVPTLDGDVHEIELAGGMLLGRYKLGQSLSVGGTRFGEGKQLRLYFPGDDSCVYVLDVANHECQAVLYTDHEAGSLRSEPILLPSEDDPRVPGYLVLCQAHGLDATRLRTFRLLPPDPNAAAGSRESRMRAEPVAMPERSLRGWPWFPPYRDPEKLVTVTDAGVLGLFGIVQAGNKDDPLFPLVRAERSEDGTVELPGQGTARGRAQVVYAQENDLWVLARGRLLRYCLGLDPQVGPRVVADPRWERPLELGSPLHESQLDEASGTLFLVTQSPNGQACLATAVDSAQGTIRWQRQLGLVCHGDPQPLGTSVVALDQGGGLFLFDPARHPANAPAQWQSAGTGLAGPLPDGVSGPVYLIAAPDGQSVYEFACVEPGNRLIVRVYHAGDPKALQYVFDLPARLSGTPAVGENRLLLPLSDGATQQLRLPLLDSSKPEYGPNWRSAKSGDATARGHVVWLGGDDFLTSNGQRGLTHWRFRQGFLYDALPEGLRESTPTLELPEPIAGTPVVLARGGTALRVCVADAKGTVSLFEGDDLKLVRQWELKGAITAGPFVRGGAVACVVEQRRLVWLDPAREARLWTYESPGEGIVGQPQTADGLVLVADVTGRFVGLDPATGQARGPGYRLRASVAPAASPVGFGAGRAFAPLTDGTVLLLSLTHLREPPP